MPFSKSNRPLPAGAYFNFEGVPAAAPVPPAVGGVVAIPFLHDWGPLEQSVYLNDYAHAEAVFGTTDTDGLRAIRQAFKGEGLPEKGGAGTVLAYRLGGTDAAKATRTLQNTTPASAVALSARYQGSRGNALRVTVQADPTAGFKQLIVLDGTTVLETYVHAQTNLAALVADINARSNWITASLTLDGVALNNVSSQALTGGDDGDTLVAGDWTDAMTALEVERFSLFAPYDLTDSSILAALKTWVVNQNDAGQRFMAVVGGSLGETSTTANTRSATLADPNIVNLGIGTYTDDELATDGSLVTLSTSKLAPRIAGVLAARGEGKSITFARFSGLSIVTGRSKADVASAYAAGTVTLGRDSHPVAPVRVDKGLTTYVLTTDPNRPYKVYSRPKFVRTMEGIELELREFVEQEDIAGVLPVSDKTRNFLVAAVDERLKARVTTGAIQPDFSVSVDTNPPPSDDDEFVALVLRVKFARSVEQVYFTVRVS